MKVDIKVLSGGYEPKYMTDGAAGMDCFASITVTVPARGRRLVPLGFAIAIPEGCEGQIRPRSGMGRAHGVFAALGTIDSDYRGEVGAMLVNTSDVEYEIEPGMRVCQLVIAPVLRVELLCVVELSTTVRGEAGFGSTGTK